MTEEKAGLIRTGDHVKHFPTGETWVVRRVIGDRLEWYGWPPGEARLGDCTLVYACTDGEHRKALAEVGDGLETDRDLNLDCSCPGSGMMIPWMGDRVRCACGAEFRKSDEKYLVEGQDWAVPEHKPKYPGMRPTVNYGGDPAPWRSRS